MATAQAQSVAAATLVESLACCKALLKLSVFQICHLRALLPEEAFSTRSLAGIENLREVKVRRSPTLSLCCRTRARSRSSACRGSR